MALVQLPVAAPGTEDVIPQLKFMASSDESTQMEALNYLNFESLEGFGLKTTNVVMAMYNYSPSTQTGMVGTYIVNRSGGKIILNRVASNLVWYDVDLIPSQLAAAGKVVFLAGIPGQSFFVRDIRVNTGTGLSGGGGDRLLSVTDGTIVYNGTGITAALIGTPVNTLWGGTGNPLPTVALATFSAPGASLYFQYTGGAADYTTGSMIVSVQIEWL